MWESTTLEDSSVGNIEGCNMDRVRFFPCPDIFHNMNLVQIWSAISSDVLFVFFCLVLGGRGFRSGSKERRLLYRGGQH